MTDLIDLYHNMKVAVTSPDGDISATGDNQYNMKISFRDEDTYLGYDAETLTFQLTSILNGLARGRSLGIQQLRNQSHLRTEDPSKPHGDANRRRYREQLRDLVAVGFSQSDVVDIAASNLLSDYEVIIDSEQFLSLDMEEFLGEFRSAYYNMVSDFREKQRQARETHLPN